MADTVFVFLNDSIAQTDLDVLSTVEQFYNNALTRVLFIIGSIIAIFGVGTPLVLNYFQRQSIKEERQNLEKQIDRIISFYEKGIDKRVNDIIENSKDEIKTEYIKALKTVEEELAHKISESYFENLSISMGLLSTTLVDLKKYDNAIILAIRAVLYSIYAVKIDFAKSLIVDVLIEEILPKVSWEELEYALINFNKSKEEYISDLHNWDRKVELDSEITSLETALNKKLTEQEKPK
ncbi:hypothetical protein ACFLTA_08585 [Bacteroidota bacterium]